MLSTKLFTMTVDRETESNLKTWIETKPDGKKPNWPPFWLEEREDRLVLCRKSHPSLPDDINIDYLDCEFAFELAEDY